MGAEPRERDLYGPSAAGPREELIALVQRHEPSLYRYLLVLTGEQETARDCLQDTFMRAYEYLTVVVLLNEPSPAVIRTRELVLGQHTVRLTDGRDAWSSVDVSAGLYYVQPKSAGVQVLAWIVGAYVVSLWSDLPQVELRRLAEMTTVAPLSPRGTTHGIPRCWPTPQPPDRLPGQLHPIVDAHATYQRRGTTLTIRYLIQFGAYSQGALYGLDKWKDLTISVSFPAVLRSRTRDQLPHQNFGADSGSGGTGGDLTFNTTGMSPKQLSSALRSGARVQLAWLERGIRHRRSFHLALSAQQ